LNTLVDIVNLTLAVFLGVIALVFGLVVVFPACLIFNGAEALAVKIFQGDERNNE
jgi:hypothetical protein